MGATFESGLVVDERYALDRLLGEGNIGQVWLATDLTTGERVAMKTLRTDRLAMDGVRRRFEIEGRVLSQLDHPNIARAYDMVTTASSGYIVLEYVEGRSLSEALDARQRQGERLSFEEVLAVAWSIAEAAHHAHELGFVHRDIKPANVMMSNDGVIKLLDFGIAKLVFADADRQTTVGRILGTISYLSPEQAMGEGADRRSDVFALSSMIFELFTFCQPWMRTAEDRPLPRNAKVVPTGNGIVDVIGRIVYGHRPSASELRSDLPEAASNALKRGMAIEPNERFSTVIELVEELVDASPRTVTEPRDVLMTRVFDAPTPSVAPTPSRRAPARRSPVPLFVGAAAIAASAVLTFVLIDRPPDALFVPTPRPQLVEHPTAVPVPAPVEKRSNRRRSRRAKKPPSVTQKRSRPPVKEVRPSPVKQALANARARNDVPSLQRLRASIRTASRDVSNERARRDIRSCVVKAGFSSSLSELEVCVAKLDAAVAP